ncbi:MAG: EpsI family protein [Methylotenera sp.]|uniref:exosortase-associated protein EpsI, B-type n=1 Tax=Methylotenera sp. TaxID=2051956 RepID=UPI00271F99A2|nr:exosortase-associated protein EpsI, B-type [Methylotenera sp.]MDO9149912.1 EpsI family protein [Methylotenera sp.]
MNSIIRNIIIAVLMFITSGVALALRPTERIADEGPAVDLETIIPKQFGDWQEEPLRVSQIVNPQQKQVLDEIYTQILSRTYINNKGERIMLSIAYGADQSDAKQLHYPEVCYPAQGFQIISSKYDEVITSVGNVRVKRMMAILGDRTEPVTYWSTVGNKVVVGGKETKLEQLRYGFKGKIPDGLLFRVSSINNDPAEGYMLQDDFLNQIVTSMPINNRLRIAGI